MQSHSSSTFYSKTRSKNIDEAVQLQLTEGTYKTEQKNETSLSISAVVQQAFMTKEKTSKLKQTGILSKSFSLAKVVHPYQNKYNKNNNFVCIRWI